MIWTNKKQLLRVVAVGMACLWVPACWLVMSSHDNQEVNVDSENSRPFYYSTLNEITGEDEPQENQKQHQRSLSHSALTSRI